MTNTNSPKVWQKNGSRDRIIRNAYAYQVMVAMCGSAMCPNCGIEFNGGEFDVDRINGSSKNDKGIELYMQGEIVYLCNSCNQARSLLQNVGADWPHAEAYKNDVINASKNVAIPSEASARAWWDARPVRAPRQGRYSA